VPGIERAVQLTGCRFPPELATDLRAHVDDKAAVRKIGVEFAAGMCETLLAEGVPGLHFYTLNGSRATREIYQVLGLGPKAGS
jgi:methylenetetrahydrofolate reductase (NADPH)